MKLSSAPRRLRTRQIRTLQVRIRQDPIVEYDEPRALPEQTWLALIALPDSSDVAIVGTSAWFRGETAVGERGFRQAAEAGNRIGAFNFGVVLQEWGELVEAERWYRAAAEAGNSDAMSSLADLLQERGDAEEAEQWRRRADENPGA